MKKGRYLALALAGLLPTATSGTADAEWNGSAQGAVVGATCIRLPDANGGLFYGRDGQAWVVGPATAWERRPEYDLPVAANEVKFLTSDNGTPTSANIIVVTLSDEVWGFVGVGATGQWQNFGAFPGPPIQNDATSWGRVKDSYRRDGAGK